MMSITLSRNDAEYVVSTLNAAFGAEGMKDIDPVEIVVSLDVEAEIEMAVGDGYVNATIVLMDGTRIPAKINELSRKWV